MRGIVTSWTGRRKNWSPSSNAIMHSTPICKREPRPLAHLINIINIIVTRNGSEAVSQSLVARLQVSDATVGKECDPIPGSATKLAER